VFNSVRLLWILGHSDIPGNETADLYAKQAASQDFVGPEPVSGIYLQRRFAVQLDCGPMHNSVSSGKPQVAVGRQKCSYMDQIKSFLTMLLSLPRRELKVLVGLLTGHITLNRHLTVINVKKKLQFIHKLTASDTSKTAKITKGDITHQHIA